MNECRLKYTKHPKILTIRSESGAEDVHYPLQYEGLPEETKKYAKRELNETEENKEKGIRKLKEYMKREGLSYPDESFLVMVLRNCKYDITKSKSKLKRFLRTRQFIISKISQMDMEKIEYMLDRFIAGILPWRDREGRLILYGTARAELDKYDLEDFMFYVLLQLLFILQFPMTSIHGFVYIGDNEGATISYYQIFKFLRRLLSLLGDMPLRIARIEIIRDHFLSRWCVNMLRPFLPDKIRNRIMSHDSNLERLHKFFHPDMLPMEIEGTLGPVSNRLYREELLIFIKRLRELN